MAATQTRRKYMDPREFMTAMAGSLSFQLAASAQEAVGASAETLAEASQLRRMAVLHRRTGTHGRVRGFRPGAHFRFPGWRRRLCALRHGALHREYRYHAAAP